MRFANGPATILAVLLAAIGFQSPAIAATFNVNDAAGLRAALLTAATNGQDDVIVLAAGIYATGGTTFTFVINENKTLTLQGASGTTRSQVVLDGGGTSQVLNCDCVGSCGAVTLRGLTVQNGNMTSGIEGSGGENSGIFKPDLVISDVIFLGNRSINSGGAIHGGNVTATNSAFSGNWTTYGYGGAIYGGNVSVTSSTFINNAAGQTGGAIHPYGQLTVANSAFISNAASLGGAIDGSNGTVTKSIFIDNAAGSGAPNPDDASQHHGSLDTRTASGSELGSSGQIKLYYSSVICSARLISSAVISGISTPEANRRH
jgi:predicted outer membrane repeat protein